MSYYLSILFLLVRIVCYSSPNCWAPDLLFNMRTHSLSSYFCNHDLNRISICVCVRESVVGVGLAMARDELNQYLHVNCCVDFVIVVIVYGEGREGADQHIEKSNGQMLIICKSYHISQKLIKMMQSNTFTIELKCHWRYQCRFNTIAFPFLFGCEQMENKISRYTHRAKFGQYSHNHNRNNEIDILAAGQTSNACIACVCFAFIAQYSGWRSKIVDWMPSTATKTSYDIRAMYAVINL